MPIRRNNDADIPRSVTRAIRLMSLLAESSSKLGLTEISSAAGLPKGTAHRLLLALEEGGLALRDPESRKWGLGFAIAHLYDAFRSQMSLIHVARPWMEKLGEQIKETIVLMVEHSGYGVCIERIDSNHELRVQTALGSRVPLHVGAARKLLLAFLPEERRERAIAELQLIAYTPRTVTDPKRLREDLEEIRRQGYAVSSGEHRTGVIGLAAPVLDATGRVVASLSAPAPSARVKAEEIELIIPALLETARQISGELGYREYASLPGTRVTRERTTVEQRGSRLHGKEATMK